jgi:hypothetical protein
VAKTGQSWSGEFMVFCKGGEYLPALITLSPLLDENGASIGVIEINLSRCFGCAYKLLIRLKWFQRCSRSIEEQLAYFG